ncbi:MAG: alpha/beta hydrolase [Gammaproteobacteria bacterium]|nr:alpha/beta hydrolase [Gammaproteobacteria bacterium]
MSSNLLETVEIGAAEVKKTIIWLHGLGADGHDFEPIVPEFSLPDSVRFVFPHAPARPITANNGVPMRGWYDIVSFDKSGRADAAGIEESSQAIRALIARENERGVPAENIILAGFSQGGAIALHLGLRYSERLAGIIGLSTYLPLRAEFDAADKKANLQTPIFMAHGSLDNVLIPTWGEESSEFLKSRNYDVEWHEYPMMHQVCMQELHDLSAWIKRVFEL